MVDARRLAGILRRVAEDVGTLKGYAGRDAQAVRNDVASLGHVKYLFVTAVEGCVDAAHHVIASEGWAAPSSNAEAMRLLANHAVVEPRLGEAMARAVVFRNILVHRYRQVDDAVVVANLAHLHDFDAFVAALARLIPEPDAR